MKIHENNAIIIRLIESSDFSLDRQYVLKKFIRNQDSKIQTLKHNLEIEIQVILALEDKIDDIKYAVEDLASDVDNACDDCVVDIADIRGDIARSYIETPTETVEKI